MMFFINVSGIYEMINWNYCQFCRCLYFYCSHEEIKSLIWSMRQFYQFLDLSKMLLVSSAINRECEFVYCSASSERRRLENSVSEVKLSRWRNFGPVYDQRLPQRLTVMKWKHDGSIGQRNANYYGTTNMVKYCKYMINMVDWAFWVAK